MKSDKDLSPAPKVSSQPKGNYTGKWYEPAEEFLEVGPSHGISPENSEGLEIPQTSTQKQEKRMVKATTRRIHKRKNSSRNLVNASSNRQQKLQLPKRNRYWLAG